MGCSCVHITDIGVGYVSTMLSLTSLFLRWCTQLRDYSLQHLNTMRNLQILSLAGKLSRLFIGEHESSSSAFRSISFNRMPTADIQRSIQHNSVASFARARIDQLSRRIAGALWILEGAYATLLDYWIRSHATLCMIKHVLGCPKAEWYVCVCVSVLFNT